ncbi:hypothetical protein [Kitasatospora indigofera]|uniref:hypothetical protein n=1 Tax=Kitasatospora indigofera TaxID=67307 RepID=UPI0033B7C69C
MPFAFAAGARGGGPAPGYLSNVAPPARARAPLRTVCARTAVGLLLVAGLVAAVALGTPALSAPGSDPDARPAPARGHR